jgi:hypothetical protein
VGNELGVPIERLQYAEFVAVLLSAK